MKIMTNDYYRMRKLSASVVKYKKSPEAPRRFKSSYMFFSTIKHKEIRAQLIEKYNEDGRRLNTTEVAKMVSKAWKALPEDERAKWDEIAKQDKARYEMEKSTYTGPWKVAVVKQKKKKKDLGAPKRPMSAFLSFLHSKRKDVKNEHKDATNTDISRILAKMWKDADMIEKEVFINEEFHRRQEYKEAMSKWKMRQGEEMKMKTMREERECEAMVSVLEGNLPSSSSRSNDGHLRSVSLSSDSTVVSSVSNTTTTASYSTQLAADIFAPPSTSVVTNPYPPHSKPYSAAILSSSSNQQQQYPPSSLYNYDHQPRHEQRKPLDAYNNQNTYDCTNSYGRHTIYEHQALSAANNNANTYDVGGQQQYQYGPPPPPPPPPYYNQLGNQHQQPPHGGSASGNESYYHYDQNEQHHYDRNFSRSQQP